jgi:hypothetical protein
MAGIEKFFRADGSDITGTAGDKDVHGDSVENSHAGESSKAAIRQARSKEWQNSVGGHGAAAHNIQHPVFHQKPGWFPMRARRKIFHGSGIIIYLLPPTLFLAWEIRHFARQDVEHRIGFGLAFIILSLWMLIWREINRLTQRRRKRRSHHHDENHR